jgi:hypothetical protein
LSLTGDGQALHLNGAPADPSYVASYPVPGFSGMTVTASAYGDLTAACAGSGGAAACKSLPFFTEIGEDKVKVSDPYGHVVLALPLPPGLPSFDAGVPVPPVPPTPTSFDAGSINVGIDAGGCAPSVNASIASCTLTIGGVTCDCSDATCAANAIEACLTSTGVPAGNGTGGGGGILPDAGVPGAGWPADAGTGSAACSSTAIMSAKTQFCLDVDSWLSAHGLTTTLDCAKIGTLTFPTTLPAAMATGFTCDQITHDAFVTVRATLATCDPLSYVGWDSSAELQLFEASACTVW